MWRYTTCHREALPSVLALRRFRLYLLSLRAFQLLTDHLALRFSLARYKVHGRLARWLDFLAEYGFHIEYESGSSNEAADSLSRPIPAGKSSFEKNEGVFLCPVTSRDGTKDLCRDSKPTMREVARHLAGPCSGVRWQIGKDHRSKKVRKTWKRRLYQWVKNRPVVVRPIKDRLKLVQSLHDDKRYWDTIATGSLVTDQFWLLSMLADVEKYARVYDICQQLKRSRKFDIAMKNAWSILFDVSSTDLVGPFPETASGNQFLLICVMHLARGSLWIQPKSNSDSGYTFYAIVGHFAIWLPNNGGKWQRKLFFCPAFAWFYVPPWW